MTIKQAYDDYLAWQGVSEERESITFEDYLRDEVYN
jgi:hypothetical protein